MEVMTLKTALALLLSGLLFIAAQTAANRFQHRYRKLRMQQALSQTVRPFFTGFKRWFEQRRKLNNNAVNFLSTLAGAWADRPSEADYLGNPAFHRLFLSPRQLKPRLIVGNSETIETRVTDPIEESVNTLSSIKKLQSTSYEGMSVVIIEFELAKNIDVAYQEVQQKLSSIRADLPYKSFDDIRKAKEELIVGTTGPGSNAHDFPLLLKEFAGVKLKLVSGYPSNGDIQLAIQRKEVDAWAALATTIKLAEDQGIVRAVVRGRVAVSGFEKLPVDEDLATSPLGKALMGIRAVPLAIGRAFAAPPATPADRACRPAKKLSRQRTTRYGCKGRRSFVWP